MCGQSAVAIPALLSIRSLQCLRFAVIPVIQFTISVSTAFSRVVMDSNRLQNTTGSKAFSSSCPASAAMVMVVSCPTMWNATWLTTSGMTGFTLPGIMEEPFCLAGRLISPKPVFGPEDIRRRSLHILERSTAQVFITPDTATKPSRFSVASKRSSACLNG